MPQGATKSKTLDQKNEAKPGSVNPASATAPVPGSSYAEIQNEEVEVLKAIYADGFEEVQTKTAWSKTHEKSFRLRLPSYSDQEVYLSLLVTLTATYPKTLPILKVESSTKIPDDVLKRVRELLATKPHELVGEVMIHEIATTVQDVLEDVVSATAQKQTEKAVIPSLEEERAVRELAASREAKEREKILVREQQAALVDEERNRTAKIDEEIKRRDMERVKRRSDMQQESEANDDALPVVSLDQPVNYVDEVGHEVVVRKLILTSILSNVHPSSTVFAASSVSKHGISASFVLKRINIRGSTDKEKILALEKTLERMKAMRHANISTLVGFRIEPKSEGWCFDVVLERASKGSLAGLLAITDTLPPNKARLLGIEILQGLDFLHRNGVIHGRLHTENILLHGSINDRAVLKVADAAYEDAVHDALGTYQRLRSRQDDFDDWPAPELHDSAQISKTRKLDIWAFGIIMLKMVHGLEVCRTYATLASFHRSVESSAPFEDLLDGVFRQNPSNRPSAFELIPYEFFRADGNALPPTEFSRTGSSRTAPHASQPARPISRRMRHESSTGANLSSRYGNEWDEIGRLGRGGYGEVVKSRNKMDGRVYAIKKITQKTPAELSQVLSEVHVLAQLNHPYTVRYYGAWPEDEEVIHSNGTADSTSSGGPDFLGSVQDRSSPSFGRSGRGLDFISSSGYPKVEFGYDDDDEAAVSDCDSSTEDNGSEASYNSEPASSESADAGLRRHRSSSRPLMRTTLYIQMEYCERLTLRDLIRKDLASKNEEIWRLLRQLLEGLVHIHSLGILHRDLKPENVFIDATGNPRIGDFGLATSGHSARLDQVDGGNGRSGDMTGNVGTALYVAPELLTKAPSNYTNKIDMYSLGIIFFEMSLSLSTGMERLHILTAIRQKDHILPDDFRTAQKAGQAEVIELLISHQPSSRPTAAELLQSGKVPAQVEDATVRLALESLADESSPYHHKVMSALFSKATGSTFRAQLWDRSDREATQVPSATFSLSQGSIKDSMVDIFRRHGAVELARQGLTPRSELYNGKNVYQMLDASGTMIQLPYDLTMPLARMVAKGAQVPCRTYYFGTVFRDALNNGAPRTNREADFDICTTDPQDNALHEAEVIKVVDELLLAFPSLASVQMCFHVSHSGMLEIILESCRIPKAQRPAVTDILGRLNIHSWTWEKIRAELRGPALGIASTSLDELARFDFRDSPENALIRLQALLSGSDQVSKLNDLFVHITGLVEYCKRFNVRRKVYVSPLSSFNHEFYEGGIIFQCIFDNKKRDVLAAGGRYDSLIEAHRPRTIGDSIEPKLGAVGVNIAWDRIVTSMVRLESAQRNTNSNFLKKEEQATISYRPLRKTDVLIASFSPATLRSTAVRLLAQLWAADVGAELASDASSLEELTTRHKEDRHSWIVIVRQEGSSSKGDLRLRSLDKRDKEDVDVSPSEIVQYLRNEIRARDEREGTSERTRLLAKTPRSIADATASKSEVRVLTAAHKSKKSNKMRVVESSRAAAKAVLESFADAPIVAVETRDDVLDKIRDTRLNDPDSWKRAIQDVPLNERQYLREVQDEVISLRGTHGTEHSNCFIYNFRTGTCICYPWT